MIYFIIDTANAQWIIGTLLLLFWHLIHIIINNFKLLGFLSQETTIFFHVTQEHFHNKWCDICKFSTKTVLVLNKHDLLVNQLSFLIFEIFYTHKITSKSYFNLGKI